MGRASALKKTGMGFSAMLHVTECQLGRCSPIIMKTVPADSHSLGDNSGVSKIFTLSLQHPLSPSSTPRIFPTAISRTLLDVNFCTAHWIGGSLHCMKFVSPTSEISPASSSSRDLHPCQVSAQYFHFCRFQPPHLTSSLSPQQG